jgi:tetratricopeptide (TPR) repeat protein/TolB-like protein
MVAVAALALIGTAGMLVARPWARRAPAADPRGLVVAGFENRTGDSTLAPLGEIATDYIARGLAATGLIHDVYDSRTATLEADGEPKPGPGPARQLARLVGAGMVLWGSYYLRQDTVHFEAQLVDAASGKLVLALAPVSGPRGEQTRVVEVLRQRVMAGFAVALDPAFSPWRDPSVPPTYDAYREMLAADEAGWNFDFSEAARHLRKAEELDSTYVGARSGRAVALALAGGCAEARDVMAGFEGRLTSLTPVQHAQLDWARASCDHDIEGQYRASRAALAASPRSLGATVLASLAASQTNRRQEALEILRRFDARKFQLSGTRLAVYMDWLAAAYHAVGDYRSQLAVAREGLRDVPGYTQLETGEGAALAALGDTAAVERLATVWLNRPPGDYAFPGQQAECVALELRAHGHPESARRVMTEADQWYRRLRIDEAGFQDQIPCMWHRFSPAYYLGDWARARAEYRKRLGHEGDVGDSLISYAALGALAVRLGDRAEAARRDRTLERLHDHQSVSYARARMALLGGDRERALQLLRRAYDQGLRAPNHTDPDLEPLRSDSAYQELYRPPE